MILRLPVIPTILVVAAAGVMVWLGFWQLGRADEKAALIAEFEAADSMDDVVEIESGRSDLAYRTVQLDCPEPDDWQAVAGRNARGQSGYAHRYSCSLEQNFADGEAAPPVQTFADIGWSRAPKEPSFAGGAVTGTLVALGDGFKIIATEPLAGLQPLAKPDPNDLPNNHLAYAGQWFFFALTALVIYGFAVRSKLRKRD